MIDRILQGPFLTRAQAARRARTPARLLVHRPDLLRVDGRWLQEAYFGFQFDRDGVRPGLGQVVQSLKRGYSDIEIADWLVRPHGTLGYSAPLKYLKGGGKVERVLAAADSSGPVVDPGVEAELGSAMGPADLNMPGEVAPTRRARRGHATHRPVFGSR